jgi:hypothetical protein
MPEDLPLNQVAWSHSILSRGFCVLQWLAVLVFSVDM